MPTLTSRSRMRGFFTKIVKKMKKKDGSLEVEETIIKKGDIKLKKF